MMPNYPKPRPPANVVDIKPIWTFATLAGHTLRQAMRLIRRGRAREIIGGELTIYDPRNLREVARKARERPDSLHGYGQGMVIYR